MAEVSLRLLRGRARERLIEERILCCRKPGSSWVPPCGAPCETIGGVAPGASYRLRLYTLWPSGTHRGPSASGTLDRQMEVRLYSQWAGARASYHQNGSHPNGAPDLLHRSPTAYYDILEVTGSATQSQIKTAYYKQSFRFHPDRNAGNEDAAKQFGLVTEAYHILGSVSLRKKYDRGVLSPQDVRSAKKPSGKSGSPSRKEAGGPREASTSSKTPARPMFDFDAFYQAHYGEQLAREKHWKARREIIEKQKLENKMATRINRLGELSAVLLLFSATAMLIWLR